MIDTTRILPGLPPYGPMSAAFPPAWGLGGHEGMVVEFKTSTGDWIGNFQPGLGGLNFAGVHPNGVDAIVIAGGDLWIVRAEARTAQRMLPALNALIEVQDPAGWVFIRQDLAFARLSFEGLVWHTRRISWDGLDKVTVDQEKVTGLSWSPGDNRWYPFEVDIRTGAARGGSWIENDPEGWEMLAVYG